MLNLSSRDPETKAQRPRVSVVVIFLNEEPFLQEAVDSVLSQTWLDWELLLVDDGSTDGSSEIAEHAVRKLPHKVRLLEHERHDTRGMSASRNLGLKHARGEYVLFLDGDDVLTRSALSEQVALLDAHSEVGMVYGPMHYWFGWNRESYGQDQDYIQNLCVQPNTVIDPPNIVPIFLRDEAALPSGNLFRTTLVREVGGFEEQFKDLLEDRIFRVKFCLRFPIYAANRVWYRYRRHAGSCCATAGKDEYDEARGRFLLWTDEYCRQRHIRHPQLWQALRDGLHPYRYPRLARLKTQMSRAKSRFFWRLVEMAIPMARRVLPKTMREHIWGHVTRTEKSAISKGRLIAHEARSHS